MNKASGRKVGLICGVNDWSRKIKKFAKKLNSKIVRKNIKKLD